MCTQGRPHHYCNHMLPREGKLVLRTPRQGHGDAVTSSVPEAEEFERTLRVGRGSDLEDRDVTCCRLQLWHVLCAYVSVCARAS